MAGKGKHGKAKGKKNKPKKSKQGQTEKVEETTVKHVDEEHDQNGKSNEPGSGGKANEKNGESQKNEVLGKGDCELLEGLNINSLNHTDSRPKLPSHLPSAEESAFLKRCMEEAIKNVPVHTPDCGHPNLGRDIEDCGNNLCWVIAAMDCVYISLRAKGANYELIRINCNKLLECHKEETTGYPSIIKKAFKYIEEHNVSKDAFFPKRFTTKKKVPKEVRALRICGFQVMDSSGDIEDEFAVMEAITKGSLVAGVRQSPEFAMLGTKIYEGSANEIMIDGKGCNHGVVLLGYGYDKKEDMRYWKIRNSDGTRWGDGGYGRVARPSSLPNGFMKPLLNTIMYPIFE